MKHQYVGDINDYRKYALLRALSAHGANRIGVCWLLTDSDGSSDGGKLSYLQQPERFRQFDPELFDILARSATDPDRRRLQTIEDSGAVPNASYHNALLPQAIDERAAYMAECGVKFTDADLVFFDPDNGIDVPSTRLGRKSALKYVFLDEIAAFYGEGKAVLMYQHFPQMKAKKPFLADMNVRLHRAFPDVALFTFATAHVVFLLLIHPESPARLAIAAIEACERWEPKFMTGEYRPRPHNPANN